MESLFCREGENIDSNKKKQSPFWLESNAIFSTCRKYRYALWRTWDYRKRFVMFIGLNPSTADEMNDDPTVRRCIKYARDWDYSGVYMMNLFAYRATDPRIMMMAFDPIGAENDRWLDEIGHKSLKIIAAWGIRGSYKDRDKQVINLVKNLHCLAVTKDGHPRHPLYLRKDLRPKKFIRS